jgi:two-component system, NarL family, response regulator DevR
VAMTGLRSLVRTVSARHTGIVAIDEGLDVLVEGEPLRRSDSCLPGRDGRSSPATADGPAQRSSPVSNAAITVLLLDDHEIVRRGLRDLLEAESDITVVGEASTEHDAVLQVTVLDPDVAILDVRLAEGNGVAACRQIRSRHPRTACLILTSFSDDDALFAAIMAGAAGYVLKQIRSNDLVDAVRRVASGQNLLDPGVTARVLERLRRGPDEDEVIARLTPQEHGVLSLLAEGLTNRQIAERMGLAEKTIKNYVTSVLSKMGMARRTEAAVYAARHLDPRDR